LKDNAINPHACRRDQGVQGTRYRWTYNVQGIICTRKQRLGTIQQGTLNISDGRSCACMRRKRHKTRSPEWFCKSGFGFVDRHVVDRRPGYFRLAKAKLAYFIVCACWPKIHRVLQYRATPMIIQLDDIRCKLVCLPCRNLLLRRSVRDPSKTCRSNSGWGIVEPANSDLSDN
jgi:hypothetical protein